MEAAELNIPLGIRPKQNTIKFVHLGAHQGHVRGNLIAGHIVTGSGEANSVIVGQKEALKLCFFERGAQLQAQGAGSIGTSLMASFDLTHGSIVGGILWDTKKTANFSVLPIEV